MPVRVTFDFFHSMNGAAFLSRREQIPNHAARMTDLHDRIRAKYVTPPRGGVR